MNSHRKNYSFFELFTFCEKRLIYLIKSEIVKFVNVNKIVIVDFR